MPHASLGHFKTKEAVAGFRSHGFYTNPTRDIGKLKSLQLISLLKFAEPRAYISDHLPRMDQFSAEDFPTRELNAFEKSSLDQIWTEKDLVVKKEGDRVQLLGAIRALDSCTKCHDAVKGELLGAFSYQLVVSEINEESE